jgi:GntR family transcriptional regulator / MocR family aminotransferase
VVELPAGVTGDVAERAAGHGVLLATLEERHAATPGVHGLVIGYGGATEPQIRSGCSLVRELVREAAREPVRHRT